MSGVAQPPASNMATLMPRTSSAPAALPVSPSPATTPRYAEAGAPAHLTSPRLVLVLLWLFGNVLSSAFDRWIVPLLGFFVLPWTTLAYAAFRDWARAFT